MKIVRKRQQKNRLHHYRSQIVALKLSNADALTLLRELNDALVIPGWLQPRVDALLDRYEPAIKQPGMTYEELVKAQQDASKPQEGKS